MRNPALLAGRNFIRADVEPPIDGGGIAADDFAAMAGGQFDGEGTLACGGGAQDGQNRRTQSYILKYASAPTSASSTSSPTC
jgi:hypothetical protein